MPRRILPHAPRAAFSSTVLNVGEVVVAEGVLDIFLGDGATPGGVSILDTAISASGAGLVRYATLAEMNADASRPAGTLAYVYANNGSATDAANGFYQYGASWIPAPWYFNSIAAAAEPLIAAALQTPRPLSLSDSDRNHILIPRNAKYFNGASSQTGAIKIGLPVGIDTREFTMRVLVRDHYGSLIFHIGGTNDAGWDYATARVEGQHSILAEQPVRFGHDGTRDCVWIGNSTYAYWDNLTVIVLEATFTGNTITETWMGDWSVSLATSFENVVYGPLGTSILVTTQNLKIDPTRYGMAMGLGAGLGTGASSYNFTFGHLSGGVLTSGFNNCGFGLQTLSEATTAQACTLMGTQAGQHITTAQQATGFGIHALLSNTSGIGNCAFGAGAMEYLTTANENAAYGTYAGRDNQYSYCDFFGDRAGLYGATADYQLWIGAIPDSNGTAYADALIRGDKLNRTIRLNAVVTSDGYRFSADNAQSVGTASFRASTIYAGTGAINTSDERTKQDIGAIPDEWLDAWGEVEWSRFRFRDAVAQKGDGARWHTGLVAQRVHAAFERHGLDAFTIGLCCHDVITEQTEPVLKEVEVEKEKTRPRIVDGTIKQIVVRRDENDQPVLGPEMENYVETITQRVETGETRIVREAGDLWGLRYDECFVMEAAWQRREIERLKARLSNLAA